MSRKILLLVPSAIVLTLAVHRLVPGPVAGANGTRVLSSGWRIAPAGRQIAVGTLPLNTVLLSDGTLAVTNNGHGENGVVVLDPARGTTLWRHQLRAAWLGLAASGSRGTDTLWASGGGTNRVYRLTRSAGAWRSDSCVLADTSRLLSVAGLAVVPATGLIAAVGNLSDSVYLVDARSLERRAGFPVGHRPYTVLADSTHLYVSDWGDSTVSVIDLRTRTRSTFQVGPHPSALALHDGDLYVALAGANGVARVNRGTGQVKEQLTVALTPGAPPGSDPNALALTPDGHTLYVAMAGNNAVAVVRIEATAMRVLGMIPVGWYPTAVTTSRRGDTIYVVNGKGGGSRANPGGEYIADILTGSVSVIPRPDPATLARDTRLVLALSPFSNPAIRSVPLAGKQPSFAPALKHVVYVIRENRTYDQVLGDVRRGNGDAALAIFNDSVTPNAHAIAQHWVLFDNFYVDGDVSADGHEWTDAAFANDYTEKTWPQVYSGRRAWDLTNGEDLVNPHGRYLWDLALARGLWVVNFGEMTESDERDSTAAVTPRTNLAGLAAITARNYPGFVLSIPDTTRARLFSDSVASWDRQRRFPDLAIVWLPRDHTEGRRPGRTSPRAMVADNDLALGLLIERLARSPVWDSLAVFVLEDDAQNGPDHVDAHRSVLLVASPYARRGVVDSTFYTTSSVLHSIEMILGLSTLTQFDAAASPLVRAFSGFEDPSAFTHVTNHWPLEERNPAAFRSRIPARDLAEPDAADEVLLNREIWESVRSATPVPPAHRSLVLGIHARRAAP
ncbi:MAG TPA: beta-propeller fold lactonase family protein [Gemmatimonadales bacterium]|nr:beta-propeller fold lactonase family protein [Gemmatimonadales bacterium]